MLCATLFVVSNEDNYQILIESDLWIFCLQIFLSFLYFGYVIFTLNCTTVRKHLASVNITFKTFYYIYDEHYDDDFCNLKSSRFIFYRVPTLIPISKMTHER